MKKTIKIFTSILFASMILFTSCNLDLDVNRDPDLLNPDQLPMSAQLPSAITGIGASAGSYLAIAGGFWSQYWTQSAIANQYKTIDDYSISTAHGIVNGSWNSMFDALTEVRSIKAKAVAEENWNYYLIATSLEVYSSQILVDMYGSIPYSEANNTAILNPKFDVAEDVYGAMVTDLKDALSKDLSLSPADNMPSDTDFLFAGDMTKWTEFANTLLLKVYLRQSEIRPGVASAGINELYTAGVSFLNSDAAITQYIDEANKSNPLFESDRRQLNVATNLRASVTTGSYLESNLDSRLPFFYDGTEYQIQGVFGAGSPTAAVAVLGATDPVYFISTAESKFLQAEADLRYNAGVNAATLYNQGVMAAFSQFGLDGSSFVSGAYAYPSGTEAENIEAIITQKSLAFFPGRGYESFFDQNRTGYPLESSVPQDDVTYVAGQLSYSVSGLTGGVFPRRLEYPQQELQRNANSPSIIPVTESVWYDTLH